MKVKKSKNLKLKLIYPSKSFTDSRGKYIESFSLRKYKKLINVEFVEDDFSLNKRNVFKGIHGDYKTWKLVSCVYGKCMAIVVNCNKNSKKFGSWEKFILSPDNYFQILIPPCYGNSFLVLSDYAVYHYKQSNYYKGKKYQFTHNVTDPIFNINLPKNIKFIISKRDKKARFINEKN
jgi:dTDP-4-dehydrorhamnose 3,5-epimerase